MRFRGGLGLRLAISCALIAAICVITAGGVLYLIARDNILRAEQDRLFAQYSALHDALEVPNDCESSDCLGDIERQAIEASVQKLTGPTVLVFRDGRNFGAFHSTDGLPADFQSHVQSSNSMGWLRVRQGLHYTFLIGSPVTISMNPNPALTSSFQDGEVPPARTVDAILYGSYSLDKQQEQLNSLATSAFWLVGILAVVSAAAGVLLARWIVRPVRELREAVEGLEIGKGALSADVRGVSELTGLVGAFNAATGRLQETLTELTEAEAASRRFVADVSHELRTPVTAMVAMADVLENSEGESAHIQEAALVTARAARRLSVLTEDLLEISRFDAQKITIQAEILDVAQRIRHLVESRGMTGLVELRVEPELLCTTDPRRFEVIVANLLTNAAVHGAGPIEVAAFLVGEDLVVQVSDQGPGIAPEHVEHLFERFYKADSSRSRGGTGLGLALVVENAKLLGGTVELRNPANPTVFTVTLPGLPTPQ